jgi:perosamine synthetase
MSEKNTTRIPVASPYLSPRITEYLNQAISNGELSGNFGQYIDKFEKQFSKFCDVNYSIAVNNGTCALHVAMEALGIQDGDEVLVQSLTNMASAFSVSYTGAIPIPVDIEPDTLNINPALVEGLITKKTKAIMVVHLFGHPVDMDPIIAIAKKYNLFVIEDCAEAHGATYKGRKLGGIGDIGCYSLYANKIVAAGEGGVVTTNSKVLANRVRELRGLAYGVGENRFMHEAIGFNYRMPNTIAAIACAQLEDVDFVIQRKLEIAQYYSEKLADINEVQLPTEKDYAKNVYWMYHIILRQGAEGKREHVMNVLSQEGVETRVSFTPLNQQKIYIEKYGFDPASCPIANSVGKNGFYLPSGPLLTYGDQDYVIENLKNTLHS